jgi:prolyl-tRNA editing enzyme YbaK/EbsC (Cys-tRNA(Pro) deacylase)
VVVSGVVDYLLGQGNPFLVLPASRALNPREAVAMHDVDPHELVTTSLVISRSGPTLMVTPAERVLDVELAQRTVSDPGARMATHAEIRSFAPGCDLDGLPPLSLYLMASMYVDPVVAELEQIVFPAGRVSTLICMERADLLRDHPYVIAALTRESYVPEPMIAPSRRAAIRDEDLVPYHVAERTGGERRPADVA